jgi:hypothetical protein
MNDELTGDGIRALSAGAVVITTGTFLRGLIHLGEKNWPAGRVDEAPAMGLSASFERPAATDAAMPWWSRRRAMGEEAAPATRAEHVAMACIGARPVHDEGGP